MKSKVYFSKKLTPERVIDLYKAVGLELKGKIGVKVHSGEEGNQNFLRPEFLKPMIQYVNGTVIECKPLMKEAGIHQKNIKDYLKNMVGINIFLLI